MDVKQQLEAYREEIDALDVELIDVLARRINVVRRVGVLKSQSDIAVVQPKRAEMVKERAVAMGREKDLDGAFVRAFYDLMIDHAHVLERAILEDARS